jgi:hypothetical protein
MRAVVATALSSTLVLAATARAAETSLPLPDAPVRLVIPDATAFDAALTGAFRRAAAGDVDANDPLVAAWRQSPVGAKLEAEWEKLSGELPWTWAEIRRLQPRSVGLALLSAGALEAVVAIDTPLATLPVALPAGKPRSHAGVAYSLVARGAGDAAGGAGDQRRLGLAWARRGRMLLVATSERALKLALDEAAAGRGAEAFLPGLASLELDLDRLREDRYFVREFAPGLPSDQGRVRAALRLEEGRIVEVREGRAAAAMAPAFLLADAADAAVAGWEPEGAGFFRALRGGILEPQPALLDRPVPALAALPATAAEASDRYLVHLDQPRVEAVTAWEAGDLAAWDALLAHRPAPGWGFWADAGGARAVVFEWPEARQEELETACRDTLVRRAGSVTAATAGDAVEMRVGPGLEALALRRTGAFVWIGTSAAAVAARETPLPDEGVVRWGRVDLTVARAQADAWARAEGPAAPERVRPFSDRVLGLLGWIPSVKAVSVERRQSGERWTERVVFETR